MGVAKNVFFSCYFLKALAKAKNKCFFETQDPPKKYHGNLFESGLG